jgi:hypothetical protein
MFTFSFFYGFNTKFEMNACNSSAVVSNHCNSKAFSDAEMEVQGSSHTIFLLAHLFV